MNFRNIFPLFDSSDEYSFQSCLTLHDFLEKCIFIYFTVPAREERVRESCLSVYMAFRDHYPDFLEHVDQEQKERLDFEITQANPKIIKLRRIVISALAKAINNQAA